MPRPKSSTGLPVPYLASAPDALGRRSQARFAEVIRDDLCQVCGEPAGWPAFGVIKWHGQPTSVAIALLDHGLLHERCARLALCNCPELVQWDNKALVILDEGDIERGKWAGSVLVPPERQADRRVDVESYRSLDPRGCEGNA